MNAFESLISAGMLAPSGDNTQPWSFEIDRADGTIRIRVNEARDRSPMNAGQRMARIAVGAAAQNVIRTARFHGRDAGLQIDDASGACEIRVGGAGDSALALDPVIERRVTNRRLYDRSPVSPDVAARLKDLIDSNSPIRTEWALRIDPAPQAEPLKSLAAIISDADAILFQIDAMRQAFFANVRFDADDRAAVPEGLSLGSLEVQGFDRTAFRMLPKLPGWLFRGARIAGQFATKTSALVSSASGVCLLIAPDDSPATDVKTGLAMEQAWLELSALGCAVQPMMSLPVLLGAIKYGVTDRQLARVPALVERLQQVVPAVGAGRIAAMLRFGKAPEPTGRTGRLDRESVMRS